MTTMSAIETDLDDDGGLRSKEYLDALVDRAPSVDSLLNDVRRLQIYKGNLSSCARLGLTIDNALHDSR